jgi:hypothetical protein
MKVSLPRKFDNADPSVQALLDDPQLLGGRPSTPSHTFSYMMAKWEAWFAGRLR